MNSTIVSDIHALAVHHRALDRLKGRSDIRGHAAISAALQAYLPRLLVAGLDYDAEPGTGGWPLPTGGRYRKLCFSPIVEKSAKSKLLALGVHDLPKSENEFQEYISLTTGFPNENAEDLFRIYRVDPGMLHHACLKMQNDNPQAWRLLLSNEFALAADAWPALNQIVVGSAFKHPLVHGFMFLAEMERASLIMRRLARADAIVDRRKLLEALSSSQPLSTSFATDELAEVYRWLDYACFSSEAVKGALYGDGGEDLSLPNSHPLSELARGHVPRAIADIIDDPDVRISLKQEFTLPANLIGGVERRKQMLRNGRVVRWYGMTNEVLPILALEGARECFPTRKVSKRASVRGKIGETSSYSVARLASALREVWDPQSQSEIVGAATKYNLALRTPKTVTLEKNLKLGRKRALTYLPPTGRLGSAARFNPLMWKNPRADNELWSMFIAPTGRPVVHRLDHPERWKIKSTFAILKRAFAPIIGEMEETALTLKIANDMAAALSPISANPQIAFAIAKLDLAPSLRKRLGYTERRSGFGRKVSETD